MPPGYHEGMGTPKPKKRRPTTADIRKAEDLLTAAGYTLTPGFGGIMVTHPGETDPHSVVIGAGVIMYAHRMGLGAVMDDKGWFYGFDS